MPPASRLTPHPLVTSRRRDGFSLIELLTVLMIIGFVAGVLVPLITGLNSDAHETRHRRNAQNIANIFMSGEAAGADFLVYDNLDSTISNIVTGSTIEHGVFAGERFAVPGLNHEERAAAARYLQLRDNRLIYNAG